MRHASWRAYLLALLATAAGFPLVTEQARPWLFVVACGSVPLATLAGVLAHRPGTRVPWLVLLVAQLFGTAADVVVHLRPGEATANIPAALAGALYLGTYTLLALALGLFSAPTVRQNKETLLDAVILLVGAGVASWVFLMAPSLYEAERSPVDRVAMTIFPLLNLALVATVLPLVLAGRPRGPAQRLLLSWLVVQVVVDSVASIEMIRGHEPTSTPLRMGWLLSFALLGAAALHPSMRELGTAPRTGTGYRVLSRMPMLSVAALFAPGILIGEALLRHQREMIVVAAASALTLLLVLARLGWLVRAISQARTRLSANERMLAESQRLARVGSWSWEVATGKMAWSAELYRLFGEDPATVEPTFDNFIERVHPEDRLGRIDRIQQALDGKVSPGREFRVQRPDGEIRIVYSEVSLVRDAAGRPERVFGMAQDITDQHRAQQQLMELAAIVEFSHDAVLRVTPTGIITSWNAGAQRLLGYAPDEVVGRHGTVLVPRELLDDPTTWQHRVMDGLPADSQPVEGLETVVVHEEGHHVPVALTMSPIRDADGTITGGAIIARDITLRRQMEEQLTRQALHDPLTGLGNRSLLLDHLDRAIEREREPHQAVALFFIDLDDFKLVNDALGHHAGDKLLIAVAGRLRACARGGDVVARLGGDEFAVVLESINESDAFLFAERLVEALRPGVDLGGTVVSARASIGIAMHATDSLDDPGTLLRKADLAMYEAKRHGKGGYQLFADKIEREFTQRLELESELRSAVVTDQFHLHYQPIVRLASGEITGFEALLRWNRPNRGPLGPDRFIPVLETSGLITQVGAWVLRQACAQAAAWRAATGESISVSVNVSPPQLNAPDFVEQVEHALARAELPADRLTLEITEGVVVADVDTVVQRLLALRTLGIRMAIDDFGTGYSSLRYLQTLPVDIVKIDRSFVAKIQEGRKQAALAKAIVGVGHALDLSMVAEGVETEEQAELLRAIGCEYGQGYHFARPQEPTAAGALIGAAGPAR